MKKKNEQLKAYTSSLQKSIKPTSAPNTLRWFDLVQNVVIKANGLAEDFPLVEINLDDVPEPAAPVIAVSNL